MYCSKCNMNISDDSIFCYRCGTKVADMSFDEPDTVTTENSDVKSNTQNNIVLKSENNPKQNLEEQLKNSQNINLSVKTNKNRTSDKLIWLCVIAMSIIILAIGSENTNNNTNNDLIDDTNTNEIQLAQTYTNKDEGISFKYPENWIENLDYANERNAIVYLEEPTELNYCASLYVDKMELGGVINDFSDLKPTLQQELSDNGLVAKEIIYTEIDGIDALKATFAPVGSYTGVFYFYIINDYVYAISFNALNNSFYEYEPIFNSIMESYKIAQPEESTPQNQNTDDYGLSEEEALEVAQEFIDTHPLYKRAVTGKIEYEPEDFSYSTKGLYEVQLLADDGSDRFLFVDKRTGSIFHSLDGITLVSGEEFYDAMYLSAQERDEVFFNGIKISDYLGSSVDDIYNDFGPPVSGTVVNGKTYTVGSYMGYDGINFTYNEDIKSIEYIVGEPKMFTYKGVTLDKSRDELVELLGKPSCETPIDYTPKNDNRILEFSMPSYTLRFDFKDTNSDTYQIALYYEYK